MVDTAPRDSYLVPMAPPPGITLDVRKIRQAIEDRALRLTEFARQAGIPYPTVSNTLSTGRPVDRITRLKFARGLGMTVEEITKHEGEEEDDAEGELRPTG